MKAKAESTSQTQEQTATPSEAVSNTEKPLYQYGEISSKLTDIASDTPYEPGPEVLNLAYYYPEGADTSDVINSYAGKLYTKLTQLEAEYMSSLYNLGDKTPLELAAQLGLDRTRVLGKFNPQDPTHVQNQPDTWTINRLKNVNISFYDGDGNRINGYSTVKEIMAMASVYCYYHDRMDPAAMEQYALELWARSHSDNISLGNVYYDSGCLTKSIEDEEAEALELERQQALMESQLAGITSDSAGDPSLASAEQGAAAGVLEAEQTVIGSALAQTTETSVQSTSSAAGNTAAESTSSSASAASGGSLAPTQAAGQSADSIAAETAGASGTETNAGLPGENGQTLQAMAAEGTQPTALSDVPSSLPVDTAASETPEGEIPSGTALIPTFAPRDFGPAANLPEAGASQETAASAGSPEASVSAQSESEPAAEQTAQGTEAPEETQTSCPGHIDLYVTVKLQGIDDAYGLFAADPTGNSEANFNEQWKGWTPERIAEARALNAQDWFTQYGLTISAINVRDPLTESEIQDYMALLPADISQTRRDLIDFALHSVGKIPYYWGGKPYAARYERNGFGTLIAPDTKGRVLRGLDCSGWINWVYWSVLGQPLKGESTATLIGCGRRISRAELKPGDIMVRTGPDAHVVMFLGWNAQGAMIVVHESGSATNNVTVSEMTADWPYYRALVD